MNMNPMEEAKALRGDTQTHYNCCQSVLVPFCQQMGLTREQAFQLGAHFGSGMRHGSTCGALTGALMVLGALGYGEEEAHALLRQFRQEHGVLDCAHLLAAAKERGQARKDHCDGMVYESVAYLEQLLGQDTAS